MIAALSRWFPGALLILALSNIATFAGLVHTRHVLVEQKAIVVQIRDTVRAARATWKAAFNTQQLRYAADAERVQNGYQTQLAAARVLGSSYKLSHRVWPQATGGYTTNPGVPQTEGAAVPEGAAATSVVVSAADFDTCTALYPYALGSYEFGQTIEP